MVSLLNFTYEVKYMLELIIICVIVAVVSIATRFCMYNAYRYDGKMKWFFHGFLRFHRPPDDVDDIVTHCKYCGKIIHLYKDDFWD